MPSFREVCDEVIEFLKTKFPEANPQFGQYGELPSETPAILIYAKPYSGSSTPINGKQMKFTIFALAGGNEETKESVFQSIELIEKIENALNEFKREKKVTFYLPISPPEFDAVYNDIAVSYIEFVAFYEASNG